MKSENTGLPVELRMSALQLMAPFAYFMDSGFIPTETNSIVLVASPLNALIRDQVTKLTESGLKACILEGDDVVLDGSLI